jgi:hypothetical protein
MDSPATHALASTHLRILSFTLVDQVEIILRLYNTQLNNLSIPASRHHKLQVIIKIIQKH